jgi:erythromycin esterase
MADLTETRYGRDRLDGVLARAAAMAWWTCACAGLVSSPTPAESQTPFDTSGRAAFISWAGRTAHPLPNPAAIADSLSSLDWLVDMVRPARVVGIGEAAHDVYDFLRLRGQITRTLIGRGGVAAIAMETGLAEGGRLSAWLAGADVPAPDFENDLSYGFGRAREIVETLRWIREYNSHQSSNRQVHFYGIDLPADGGGSLQPALRPVWAYLGAVDPDFVHGARARIDPIAQRLDTKSYDFVVRYGHLPLATRDTLRRELDRLHEQFAKRRAMYIARSSPSVFLWNERLVEVARQTEKAARIGWNDPSNPRDEAMAANCEWITRREAPHGLVLVWAHNLHVARAAIAGPLFASRDGPPVTSMGQYLGRKFGDQYVAIGAAYGIGGPDSSRTPDSRSVDAALTSTGVRRFGISIKDAPGRGPVGIWLGRLHLMHAETGYVIARIRPAFDALLFVDSVRTANNATSPD